MLLSPVSFMSMFAITAGMFFLAIPTFADPTNIDQKSCVISVCETTAR